MIWADYQGTRNDPIVTIGGKRYYYQENRKDGEKFSNYVYRAVDKTSSLNVDIGEFMRHAKVNQKADGTPRDTWLSSVTAGFELYRGSSKFKVNNFSVS